MNDCPLLEPRPKCCAMNSCRLEEFHYHPLSVTNSFEKIKYMTYFFLLKTAFL